MNKKRLFSLILIIAVITSTIFIYDIFYPNSNFEKVKAVDKLAIWTLTLVLLVYYIKANDKPQLMPSVLTNEKENNKDRDKPSISFNDVAGLEEIKEELQETIDFINNSYKYRKWVQNP